MTRIGQLFGVAALVAVTFVSPRVLAGDKELESDPVQKELADLKQELAELRKLHEREGRLSSAEMKLVNERLDRIERTLARLAPPVSTRVSSSFDPAARVPRGTIRLENRLPVQTTVTVNGVPYSVPAFGRRLLRDYPAGPLTYEVTADGFGLRPPVRTSLNGDETLTVSVYDPRLP
jgi:hypothetical protein